MTEESRKRAAWLETTSREELDAFRPISESEVREALELGERDRAAAQAQGSAAPQGRRILFR
jgi:hypothetical protein